MGSTCQGGQFANSQVGQEGFKERTMSLFVMERQSMVLNFPHSRLGILTGDPAGGVSATNSPSGGLRHPEDCKI